MLGHENREASEQCKEEMKIICNHRVWKILEGIPSKIVT